ncbi:MAG: aminotransferase class V-fold PLP-dependent enzyme [Mycobacteriaceae bacterium]|nr:aminotransferase class V-fold PLP-dependent enzyme [Mycobacteriaceae bacterium]
MTAALISRQHQSARRSRLVPVFDFESVLADTPGCRDQVFLDSAGSSLPPRPVLDAVVGHLRREAAVGGYRAAEERVDALAAVRADIATLINAQPESIALGDSATRAWTDFFYSVPLAPGDRMLISRSEYAACAIAALQRARATGAVVDIVPATPTGEIDVEAMSGMMDERVKLVSLVHAPTNGGLINPVAEATRIARNAGAIVLLDACQSVGQLPVDVARLDVDALSATGRKWLRGPRGTGFLYVRPEILTALEPQRLDLHSAKWVGPSEFRIASDATRFEFWEHNVATRLGLGAAVRYLLDIGAHRAFAEVADRGKYLRAALSQIPTVVLHDLGTQHSGIVSFTVTGTSPNLIRDQLRKNAITVTVSHRHSTLLDMTTRGLDSVVRASPHYFVTERQLDQFVTEIRRLAHIAT